MRETYKLILCILARAVLVLALFTIAFVMIEYLARKIFP